MRNREHTCLRTFLRLAAVAAVAGGMSACSSVSDATDWVNPWSSNPTPPADASAYPEPLDESGNPAGTTDTTGAYPSVASVPDKPTPSSTAQDRTQISDSLVADRGRAQYSADLLRGGTEAAAAPPPPAPPRDLASVQPQAAPADTSDDSDASDDTADATPALAPAPPPAPAQQKVAAVAPPPSTPAMASEPAVPVVRAPGAIPGAQPALPADAPLGFKPSSAPPLDSTVSQFVPAPVIARYESTQAAAATVTMPSTATKKVKVAPAAPVKPASDGDQSSISTESGSVFVNLNAMDKGARVTKTSSGDGVMQSAVYRAPGQTPSAVVFFPGGGKGIDGKGNLQIQAAAQAFQAAGGEGFIRVVGHSSSRTGNMPLAEHIAFVFKQSQERANAVAQALVRAGVPAKSVIIEAVGDTQPVYYESMPQGEEGNRRVEIFIDG